VTASTCFNVHFHRNRGQSLYGPGRDSHLRRVSLAISGAMFTAKSKKGYPQTKINALAFKLGLTAGVDFLPIYPIVRVNGRCHVLSKIIKYRICSLQDEASQFPHTEIEAEERSICRNCEDALYQETAVNKGQNVHLQPDTGLPASPFQELNSMKTPSMLFT